MGNLFLVGFILNFFKNCFLNILMLLMLFLGIWFKPCLIIGLVLLAINLILSFVIQLKIKRAMKQFDSAIGADARNFTDFTSEDNRTQYSNNYGEDKIRSSQDIIIDDSDYTVKNEEGQK